MFEPITNPYIVGNPIKTKKMFYGREDDFEFIRRKLESGSKSYIIVLSGERRSGKTSILFQILNGQLGDNFIPILIDMQTMAGLKNEAEFFEKLAQETVKYLDDRFSINNYNFHSANDSPYKVFTRLLDEMHTAEPQKNKLFLIDEYELIESKSEEGSLSPNFVPFLAGVLESERRISFIFTGSRTLEERKTSYWQMLFGKSLFRNVSFLSEKDTMRLITQPVEGKITYDDEVLMTIYRLTSGQPFYTQIVGQNIVDYVNSTQNTRIDLETLNQIVNEILENPLPQMIYFWNSLPQSQMLMLSLLAEILEDPDQQITVSEIIKQSKKKKLGVTLDHQLINTILETLYHLNYVSKTGDTYSFQIDLMRQWIKRDHSIWRVMKEVDIASIIQSERPSSAIESPDSQTIVPRSGKKWLIPVSILSIVLIAAALWFFTGESSEQIKSNAMDSGSVAISVPSQQESLSPAEPEQSERQVKNQTEKNALVSKKNKPIEKKVTNRESEALQALAVAENEQAVDQTLELEQRRSAMQNSKEQAVLAKAPELAKDVFDRGVGAETDATNYFDQKDYENANKKYREAEDYFSNATKDSREVQKKSQSQIQSILQTLGQLQNEAKPEHRTMEEYQQAETFRASGKTYNDQGNYILALENYNKAASLYREAFRKFNLRSEKIKSAINSYARAIENKNFNTSSGIVASYKKVLQNEWQPFFKIADNIDINFDIHDILFDGTTANVLVDIVMNYTGAGGSGTKNRWKFEFIESSSDWLISNITQAN